MKNNILSRVFKTILHFLTSKTIWISAFAIVITTLCCAFTYFKDVVYIVDGDTTTVALTRENDALEILNNEEILTTENDRITFVSPTATTPGQLNIERGYPVSVTADGNTTYINWFGGTVEEALEAVNVTMGAHDKITHALDYELKPYDNVTITRVAYRSYEVSVVLPMPVTEKKSSLLRNGVTRVITPGEDGLRIDRYDEILEDGVVVETLLAGSTVVKETVEEIRLTGDGSAISNFDFSDKYPLDENGIPKNYVDVLTSQRATGYWRAGRPWGASGMYRQAGTVAVRADEIPYNTKMYIRTPSGDFIYGYAVANDTGTGLMDNVIDVDLFYESYKESCWNEVRWVDIYILEYGS